MGLEQLKAQILTKIRIHHQLDRKDRLEVVYSNLLFSRNLHLQGKPCRMGTKLTSVGSWPSKFQWQVLQLRKCHQAGSNTILISHSSRPNWPPPSWAPSRQAPWLVLMEAWSVLRSRITIMSKYLWHQCKKITFWVASLSLIESHLLAWDPFFPRHRRTTHCNMLDALLKYLERVVGQVNLVTISLGLHRLSRKTMWR